MPSDLSAILQLHDTALVFISVFVFVFGVLSLGRQYVLMRTRKWVKQTETTFDDFVVEVMAVWDYKIIAIFAVYLGIQIVAIDPVILTAASQMMSLVVIVYLTLSLQKVITVWLAQYFQEQESLGSDFDPTVVNFIQRIVPDHVF